MRLHVSWNMYLWLIQAPTLPMLPMQEWSWVHLILRRAKSSQSWSGYPSRLRPTSYMNISTTTKTLLRFSSPHWPSGDALVFLAPRAAVPGRALLAVKGRTGPLLSGADRIVRRLVPSTMVVRTFICISFRLVYGEWFCLRAQSRKTRHRMVFLRQPPLSDRFIAQTKSQTWLLYSRKNGIISISQLRGMQSKIPRYHAARFEETARFSALTPGFIVHI